MGISARLSSRSRSSRPIVDKDPIRVAALGYRLRDSKLLIRCELPILRLSMLEQSKEYAAKAGAVWAELVRFHSSLADTPI